MPAKEDRREQILRAAIACFSRKGYHLTTMDDIVAESGLSKGSLYWHYKNKKDLLLSIMDGYFGQMGEDLEAVVQDAPTAAGKLENLLGMFVQAFNRPEMEQLVSVFIDFYAETRHDEEVGPAVRKVLLSFVDFIAPIVEEGIAAGEFKPVHPRQLTIALMAAFDGIYLYRMVLPGEFDLAETSRLVIELLLNGLRA
ncbi:MAG: TetR family transcriptional regulator [Anaerolineae bacterium]